MTQPFKQWTFGIEFEFVVAYLTKYPQMPTPDPSETRKVRFNPTAKEWNTCRDYMAEMDPSMTRDLGLVDGRTSAQGLDLLNTHLYWELIEKHMKNTLQDAGYQIGEEEIDKWAIGTDVSVRSPDGIGDEKRYEYAGFEVVSPAYYFCPESIQAVEDFLAILTSTYCINVNGSTGMRTSIFPYQKSIIF